MNCIVGARVESCLSFMVLPFKAMQSSSYKASYAPNYEGDRGSGGGSDCSIVQVKADWPFYTGKVWLGDAGVKGAEPGQQPKNFREKWEFMQVDKRVSSVPATGNSITQVTVEEKLLVTPQQTTGTTCSHHIQTYLLQPCPTVLGPGNTVSRVRQETTSTTPPCLLPEKCIRKRLWVFYVLFILHADKWLFSQHHAESRKSPPVLS